MDEQKIAERLSNKIIAADNVLDALQLAEFVMNELRMNGELRVQDMRNIAKYHKQMQNAIKTHVRS